MTTRRHALAVPAAALALLLLAGCSAGSGTADASMSEQGMTRPAPDAAVERLGEAPSATEEGAASAAAEGADRDVVISGWMTITATEPVDAAAAAIAIVEQAGGRVDARQEYAPAGGDRGSASLTARIPAARLTETLAQLKELGRSDEVALESSDVTVQTQDLDARISALSASVDRLTGLVTAAATTEDLIELETAISARQGELEGLQAQRRGLADQVSMSTIQLSLRSEAVAPRIDQNPSDFLSGLGAGWESFAAFWAGLLVVLGVALPWLLFLAAGATVVVLVLRRRRRGAAPAPATAPAEA